MKKMIDKDGRIMYKSSHSVVKGGVAYIHKTSPGNIIENKHGLRNMLISLSRKHKIIDTTINIYDDIFFIFFHTPKSLAPSKLIQIIQNNISSFGTWDDKYVFTSVHDLHENFLRKDLESYGFDYDMG